MTEGVDSSDQAIHGPTTNITGQKGTKYTNTYTYTYTYTYTHTCTNTCTYT